tara:strand:+ start:1433 stop:1861 length:429 start_codon:yes stop_codon:yes gene_type:complete
MIIDQLTESNKLTGHALWEALALLVDYSTGGVDNQTGNQHFNSAKPQGVTLCWNHEETRELLGVDLYHYVLECVIEPGTEISDHVVALTVTTRPFNLELIHQDIYCMKVSRFRNLYPCLMSADWEKYLSILEPDDFNEWFTK